MIISSLYGTVTSTSANANNLLYMALNYDSFKDSEYIIFQDGQYSYYIVWGDLIAQNGVVTAGNIEYIHYYRTDTSSYGGVYSYAYGMDSSFTLVLSSEYQTTSSIQNVGFVSLSEVQYGFYSSFYNYYSTLSDFLVLGMSVLLVIMFSVLRGNNK